MEKIMKAQQHIHFLSDLLYQLDQLIAMVREYCDEMVETDDEQDRSTKTRDHNNIPF